MAERYYSNLAGLELLLIDPTKLLAPIVYENTVGGDELFPHVYGEINLTAVIQVLPFELNVHYGVLQASSD